MEKFARRCNATGKGINEGYVVGDGELYFSEKEHVLSHLKTIETWDGVPTEDLCQSDEELLKFFYEEGYYYWTTWEVDESSDEFYYNANGNQFKH
jgi:hypothetical protein